MMVFNIYIYIYIYLFIYLLFMVPFKYGYLGYLSEISGSVIDDSFVCAPIL